MWLAGDLLFLPRSSLGSAYGCGPRRGDGAQDRRWTGSGRRSGSGSSSWRHDGRRSGGAERAGRGSTTSGGADQRPLGDGRLEEAPVPLRIDVPAGHDGHDRPVDAGHARLRAHANAAPRRTRPRTARRPAASPRPDPYRGGDLGFSDGDDVVEERREVRERPHADRLGPRPVGDGPPDILGRPADDVPGRSDACASAASSDSTPMTRASGRSALMAVAIPLASPPPPMGTRTAATSGRSSISSRPMVPWPATIRSSS